MEYARLGRTMTLDVSRIGVGCWAMGGHGWGGADETAAIEAIRAALDCGVTLFDTADVYGLGVAEEILAKGLGARRHGVIVSTKFGVTWDAEGRTGRDCSPAYLAHALEASLRRLRLERIPLYFIHWPDPATPLEATLEALAGLQRQGKIGVVGCSNFPPASLRDALAYGVIEVVQGPYNLLSEDDTVLRVCREANVAFIAFDVLAKGLLTGRFKAGDTFPEMHVRSRDPNFQGERYLANLRAVDELRATAAGTGKTAAQSAIQAVLATPGVACALTGVTRRAQVIENVGTCDAN